MAAGSPPPAGTLACRDAHRCPDCDAAVLLEMVAQQALLFHGGYGETRVHVRRCCPCGYVLLTAVLSEAPKW